MSRSTKAGETRIVVIDGVRYRAEDAERLGLVQAPSATADQADSANEAGDAKKPVRNKARKRTTNKTRTPATETNRGEE